MTRDQTSLAVLNVVGGVAVLASYVLAFAYSPEVRTGLWGGVPTQLQPLYTVNMLLAAAGYFPLTWRYLFHAKAATFAQEAGVPFGAMHVLYALVLIPSALWLPITAQHLIAPEPWLWLVIRAVLFAVAAGSSGLLAVSVVTARRRGGRARWLAVAGALPFWVQTAVLDALVWPAFFSGS